MPPQQTGGSVPVAHLRALIPASVMEFHIQRRWAISIFILLQAWKVADLLSTYSAAYPEQHNGLLSKWFLIDALYLIALHIAKIPWLQFSKPKTLCLILLTTLIDLTIFSRHAVSILYLFEKKSRNERSHSIFYILSLDRFFFIVVKHFPR